jgi:hypothetical protein
MSGWSRWYRPWKAIDHSDRQFRDGTSAISNSLDTGLETGLARCLVLGRADLPFMSCDRTELPEHERPPTRRGNRRIASDSIAPMAPLREPKRAAASAQGSNRCPLYAAGAAR